MSDDIEDPRSKQEKSCAALLERLRRFHPERDPRNAKVPPLKRCDIAYDRRAQVGDWEHIGSVAERVVRLAGRGRP